MKLNLKKPLVFFDLETTGVDPSKDKIVEISYVKVFPDGTEQEETMRINPGCHIPEEATNIHHITDEDVKNCPKFKDVAKKVYSIFRGCDIAGFNSNRFDLPLLAEELFAADPGLALDMGKTRLVDVQTIFHKMEQRTLVAAYKFYCGKDLEAAHSANADTRATYEVLKAQLDRYPTLQNDIEFLSNFSSQQKNADLAGRIVFNNQNIEVFNFGKHKEKSVEEVFKRIDPNYYDWMMKGDFPQSTKRLITAIKLRGR